MFRINVNFINEVMKIMCFLLSVGLASFLTQLRSYFQLICICKVNLNENWLSLQTTWHRTKGIYLPMNNTLKISNHKLSVTAMELTY